MTCSPATQPSGRGSTPARPSLTWKPPGSPSCKNFKRRARSSGCTAEEVLLYLGVDALNNIREVRFGVERKKPHILVFASGTKTGGGSGFETMVRAARTSPPILDAWIGAVITNHFDGGVWQRPGLWDPRGILGRSLPARGTETWSSISTLIMSCSPAG